MRGRPLNQQTIAALVVAAILLIGGALIIGGGNLFGTAGETPSPEAQVQDTDGDSIPDDQDSCPDYANDSIGDPCNPDEDGDGVPDTEDACPQDPNDAVGDPCNHDEDGDGVPDAEDACPQFPNDSIGDPCSTDDDGDGVPDSEDACPNLFNDSVGDPCNPDEDGDGVPDSEDACPNLFNDSVGDPCNPDEDGDGVNDADDSCPLEGDAGFGLENGCPLPEPVVEVTVAPTEETVSPEVTESPIAVAQATETPVVEATEVPTEVEPVVTEPPAEVTPVVTEAPTEVSTEATAVVTEVPTEVATEVPTEATEVPTEVPTEVATEVPTEATEVPTEVATEVPTEATEVPTEVATEVPTEATEVPTEVATEVPTEATEVPTEVATEVATEEPTEAPTQRPTLVVTQRSTTAEGGDIVSEDGAGGEDGQVVSQQPQVEAGFDAFINADGSVDFTDKTTGPVVSWTWNFGDGTGSSDQNPSHLYSDPGTYQVTLAAAGDNGIASVAQGQVTISQEQAAPMVCDFDLFVDETGEPPYTVTFTNLSSNVASYVWSINGSEAAQTRDLGPQSFDVGTYSIVLTCTDSNGGSINATGFVEVTADQGALDPVVARFVATPVKGEAPLDVTFDNISTSDASDPIVSYSWSFGAAGTSDQEEPGTINFATGVYDISLTVTTQNGRTATATGRIEAVEVADKPVPGISASPLQGDLVNGEFVVSVSGTNSGGPVDTWTWNFGNGETASGQGPHTATYTAVGSYNITLNVSGPGGTGFATQEIRVTVPGDVVKSRFTYAYNEPVFNEDGTATVCFTNTSEGPVQTSEWTFSGNGVSDTSTEVSPCYTFPEQGTYTVKLAVTGNTIDEYSDSTQTVPIFEGIAEPVAAFTASDNTVNVGDTVTFYNQTTGTYYLLEWDFNVDGTIDSNAEQPTYTFNEEGTYLVKLRATGPGGFNEAESVAITVTYPEIVCSFQGGTNKSLGQSQSYTMAVTGLGGRTATWNFSVTRTYDNATSDYGFQGPPVNGRDDRIRVTFSEPGVYDINVSVTVDGVDGVACQGSKTVTINLPNLSCPISGPTSGLPGESYAYSLSTGNLLSGETFTSVQWSLNGTPVDGATSASDQSILFSSVGGYTLSATATTSLGRSCNPNIGVGIDGDVTCIFDGWDADVIPNNEVVYTANVSNLQDRDVEYVWILDGSEVQRSGSNSYAVTWLEDGQTHTLVVQVFVDGIDGVACEGGVNQIIEPEYPGVVCAINSPSSSYVPGSDATFNANAEGLAGRTVTYLWTIIYPDGSQTTQETTGSQLRLEDLTPGVYTVTYVVLYDGQELPCTDGDTVIITVEYPNAVCRNINGGSTFNPGDTGSWTGGLSNSNSFSGLTLTYTWELIIRTGDGAGTVIASGTEPTFTYEFDSTYAGRDLQVRYTITLTDPNDETFEPIVCGQKTKNITVRSPFFVCTGVRATNDDASGGYIGTPRNIGNSYSYAVSFDGSEPADATYVWTQLDNAGGQIGQTTTTSNSVSLSWPDYGIYTLRVTVSSNVDGEPPAGLQSSCEVSGGILSGDNFNVTFTGTPTTVTVGEQICLDNTTPESNDSDAGLNGIVYGWDFAGGTDANGATTSSAEEPGCITFTTVGSKRVVLTGSINGLTDSDTDTFTVVAQAAIRASADPEAALVNQPITFTVTGDQMDLTNAVWTIPGAPGTFRGTSVQYAFDTPGEYTISVTAPTTNGLPDLTATVNVIVADNTEIAAAFTPDRWTGLVSDEQPVRICFTDQSTIQDQLNSWTWNFGNGETLSYGPDNKPAEICTEYTEADSYSVTLDVTNVFDLSARATNIVTTYKVGSGSGSIGVEIQPEGVVCFEAFVSPGYIVQEWNFGDGSPVDTSGALEICHTYSAEATYDVIATVTNGQLTYPLTTQVSVRVFNTDELPRLVVEAQCQQTGQPGTISFTITNNGGDMPDEDTITVVDNDGVEIATFNIQLAEDGTYSDSFVSFNGANFSAGQYELTGTVNLTEPCWDRSSLSVSGECAADQYDVVFYVTNGGDDMQGPSTYTLYYEDENGLLVEIETSEIPALAANETREIVRITDPEDVKYVFKAFQRAGHPGESSERGLRASVEGCFEPQTGDITVTKSVEWGDQAPFEASFELCLSGGDLESPLCGTVDQNGGTIIWEDLEPGDYTITETDPGASWIVTNASQNVTVVSGEVSDASTVINSFVSPELDVTGVCASDGALFTISNGAQGSAISGGTYTVTSGDTVVVSETSFDLTPGNTLPVSVSFPTYSLSRTLTITVNDGLGNEKSEVVGPCLEKVNITSICWETSDQHRFRITNPNDFAVNVVVFNNTTGSDTYSGTIAANSEVFYTGERATPNILYVVDGDGNRYEHARNSTNNNRCNEPDLIANGICSLDTISATFTITNTAAEFGDMFDDGSYVVKNEADETVAEGTFRLAAGQTSEDIVVTGKYGTLTLTATHNYTGITGTPQIATATATANCGEEPSLSISGICDGTTPTATITNSGGTMLTSAQYTVTYESGDSFTSEPFTLAAGGTLPISLDNDKGEVTVEIVNYGDIKVTVASDEIKNCYEPELRAEYVCVEDAPVVTVYNDGGPMVSPTSYEWRVEYQDGTVDSGSVSVDANSSTTVNLSNEHGSATFYIDAFEIEIEVENCYEPELRVEYVCVEDAPVVTVYNDGGPMVSPTSYEWRVEYQDGTVDSGSVSVDANSSTTVNLSNEHGSATFYIDAFEIEIEVENCYEPELRAEYVCVEDAPVVTVYNDGGPMVSPTSYEWRVEYQDGTVDSGSVSVDANSSTTVNLSNEHGSATFYIDAFEIEIEVENCYEPQLRLEGECDGTSPVVTVFNDGGVMLEAADYTVTYEDGTQEFGSITVSPDSFTTLIFTNGNGSLTFSLDDTEISVEVENCYPPAINAEGACVEDGPVVTVFNNGGPIIEPTTYNYVVVYEDGTEETGSFTFTNEDDNVELNFENTHGSLTFSIDGTDIAVEIENCFPPQLRIEGECLRGDINAPSAVVYNDGGPMLEESTIVVSYENGDTDQITFQLDTNGSLDISDQLSDQKGAVSISLAGSQLSIDLENCNTSEIVLEGECDGTSPVASIVNNGGPMLEELTYTITYQNGDEETGSFQLGQDEELPLTLVNTKGSIIISVESLQISIPIDNCFPPEISVEGECDGTTPTFVVRNTGGPMIDPTSYDYTVSFEDGGADETGTVSFAEAGGSQTFTFRNDGGKVTFSISSLQILVTTDNCFPPELRAEGICVEDFPTVTIYNDGGPMINPTSYSYTVSYQDGTSENGVVTVVAGGDETLSFSNEHGSLTFTIDDFGIVVDVENCYLPELRAEGICEENTPTVTVYNDGGPMIDPSAYSYTVVYEDTTIETGTISVDANSSKTLSFSNEHGSLLFGIDGTEISVSVENCYPPVLRAEGICEENTPTVTVYNDGGPMINPTEYSYTVSFEDGGANETGTISIPSEDSETLTFTNLRGSLTFSIDGTAVSVEVENCFPPDLAFEGYCDGTTPTIVITNDGGPMINPTEYPYTVNYQDGETDSGTFSVGTQTSITLTFSNEHGDVTFSTEFREEVIEIENCFPPVIRVEGVCLETIPVVTIYNDGGPMIDPTAYDYEVVYQDGTSTDGTVSVPAQSNVMLPFENTHGSLTFTLYDAEESELTVELENCFPPDLSVEAYCEENEVVLNVINNGGPMISPTEREYTISYENGDSESGTVSVPMQDSVNIPVANDKGGFSFAIPSLEISFYQETCWPVSLSAEGICRSGSGEATFTVINNGGPMIREAIWTLTNADGTDSGSIILGNGEDFTITSSVEGVSTFSIEDYAISVSTVCYEDADIQLQAYCNDDGSATFLVTNSGGDMADTNNRFNYTIRNQDGVFISSGDFVLGRDETQTVFVDRVPGTANLNFTLASGESATVSVSNCVETTPTETPVVEVPEICGTVTFDETGFPILNYAPDGCQDTPLAREPWTPINVGGAICPDWIVYHTDQTGDLEVFRLGGADYVNDDPNLSQGIGTRVYDMGPSRSPDGEWIVFSSIRDGNWEIYVAPVDNVDSPYITQRVTYNTIAMDVDPVWSPGADFDAGSLIVYESSRDDQWDLYMLDVRTGVEERLTFSQTDDVNAFWSPDGTKLVYQSYSEGFWQIFELDLANRDENGRPTITRISDGAGDDHDPMYSNDGERILFRSYRLNDNSVIFVMDADGSNVEQISDENGNATNAVWSPDDRVIAYQSNLDGDLDIYAYEFETDTTRLITDNDTRDYAPTWICESTEVVFTSYVDSTETTIDPNIFSTNALPIEAPAIIVEDEANRLTTSEFQDQFPQNSPAEENASRGKLSAPENNK